MKKIVLHIGAPKCASSTIQKYLGERFADPGDIDPKLHKPLRYVCLKEDGRIFWGRRLYIAQKLNAMGYESSASFSEMRVPFRDMIIDLCQVFSNDDVVVMSCEGWAADDCLDSVKDTLEELGIEVDIFFVTRPPVDWMNSAWWQWGVWGGIELKEWVREKVDVVNFGRQLKFWSGISVVGRVRVCDLSQSPLYLLQDFLGVPREDVKSLNVRTSPALLDHLLRNKERHNRTVHNPEVEFKIGSILRSSSRRLPSVVNGDLSSFVISRLRGDNIDLLNEISRGVGSAPPDVVDKYLNPAHASDAYEGWASEISTNDEKNEFVSELIEVLLETGDILERIKGFDPSGYLDLNPDVKASGINPYEHFLRFGIREDRVY